MNKIYIDVGANIGITINRFKNKLGPFDKVYAFEPNDQHHHLYDDPNIEVYIQSLIENKAAAKRSDHQTHTRYSPELPMQPSFLHPLEGVELIKKAVWTHNGEIPLYIDDVAAGHGPAAPAASIFKKQGLDQEEKSVQCIDFSEWLLNNLKAEDYNILKMDIEGAEFKTLNHALDNGGLELLDELYVEHHKARAVPAGRDGRHIRDHAWGASDLRRRLEKLDNLKILKFAKWIEESVHW